MNTPQEFAALLEALRALPPGGGALATLTRTRGSTFRRAGARMLVLADGRLVRGLSAGCPERDIATHALDALAENRARLLRYDAAHGGDVLMEMGCGGELEVLIEPLRQTTDWQFAEAADKVLRARRGGVMATLVSIDDRVPARPPHWLCEAGHVVLDEFDDAPLREALQLASANLPAGHRPGMLSLPTAHGGTASLLVEPLLAPLRALLVGVNAGTLALARLLQSQGWLAQVIDPREVASEPAVPMQGVTRGYCPARNLAARFTGDARSFAVVMTHNLEHDIEYLRALRELPLAYLGAVGSRARASRLFEASGLGPDRLRCPAGLDLGSETPEEIALSIAAEMLAVANATSAAPLGALQVPIHR